MIDIETSNWVVIGKVTDIPRRGARCVLTPAGKIAIFRTQDDHVFAIDDRCPHKGGPLSQGIVHDASVTCPLHNQVIALDTGEVQGPDVGEVRTYALRVDPLTEVIEMALPATARLAEAAE